MSTRGAPPSRSELLAAEKGAYRVEARDRVAMVCPSPYRAAMSSLGYQTIYRLINETPEWAADRAVLPDDVPEARRDRAHLETFERDRAVGDYGLIAFSVAYELEIAGVIDCLELARLPPLVAERNAKHALIVAGGPLTFSNPAPLAPFFDVIVVGEGEDLMLELLSVARDCDFDKNAICEALRGRPGFWIPASGAPMEPVARASMEHLPARSAIISPHAELASMYMTEAARGCSRGCTYCVMRRSTNGGMRVIDPETILAAIPEQAQRVGLVGAAVTDHPRIVDIVRGVVERGKEVGISSLRADRLSDELVELLARGGYRTLTVAFDGASARLRKTVERRTTEAHILKTAELARKHGLRTLKLYMLLGLPGETEEDIAELAEFLRGVVAVHPRVALGVAPFVAKRNTPLDGAPFAGIKLVDARLKELRRRIPHGVTVRPVSARWAWVEYMLAQSGPEAGLAVLDAHRAGGTFADYKRAFSERGVEPTGPVARVPSTAERIELHQLSRRATS